jgi:hypothetical protein
MEESESHNGWSQREDEKRGATQAEKEEQSSWRLFLQNKIFSTGD